MDFYRGKMDNMNSNAQYSDELSFVELIKTFWERRALILIVTFICFCLSLGYLFFAKPKYEANAFVTPPLSLDLSTLNVAALYASDDSILQRYSVANIYNIYIHNLTSESAKRRFFEKVYLPYLGSQTAIEFKELAYQEFLNILKIKQDPTNKSNYNISIVSHSSQEAQELLSEYLQLVFEELLIDIKRDFNYQVKAKLLKIKTELASIKRLSQKYMMNSLSELQNALDEAKADNVAHTLASKDNGHFESFMLGTKILTARIKGLRKQEIAPALVKQYVKLKTDYNFYSTTANNFSLRIQSTQFSSEIFTPELPISPKRSLILFIGLMGGCILGFTTVIIAFVINQNNEDIKTRAKCHSSEVFC